MKVLSKTFTFVPSLISFFFWQYFFPSSFIMFIFAYELTFISALFFNKFLVLPVQFFALYIYIHFLIPSWSSVELNVSWTIFLCLLLSKFFQLLLMVQQRAIMLFFTFCILGCFCSLHFNKVKNFSQEFFKLSIKLSPLNLSFTFNIHIMLSTYLDWPGGFGGFFFCLTSNFAIGCDLNRSCFHWLIEFIYLCL